MEKNLGKQNNEENVDRDEEGDGDENRNSRDKD